MNRIDELTDRLIDGSLTDAEAVELESLLAADPDHRARHVALLDVEAALRGLRTDLDLATDTVAKIEADRAERTASTVMARIAGQPSPRWTHRKPVHRVLWASLAALAFTLLVAVWLMRPPADGPQPIEGGSWQPVDVARITTLTGFVELLENGVAVPFGPDRVIAPGQTLRTVGEDSVAIVELPDRTRIELHPETTARFDATGTGNAGSLKLFLVQGQLSATISDRRAVVATEAAEVVVQHGGSFSLWSAGPQSVRVEVQSGDVQVVRGEAAKPIPLAPGQAAFVQDEASPVRMEVPLRLDTTPRNQFDFRGANSVAFTADDREVWAASAKQFVRWHIGADGRGNKIERELFGSGGSNDGFLAVISPDRRSLASCWLDDREERVLIRDLPGGAVRHSIPVRVSEPRFFCVSPDAGWIATTGGKPNNRVRVWDTATGRERFNRQMENNVYCMAATPDCRLLAVDISDLSRATNNKVIFLDPDTGATAFTLPTQRRTVTAMTFSPDGNLMFAGFNGAVQVWDVSGRKLLRTIQGFERVVTCLAYSPTTELIAAGTQDGQVWVWSARNGRRVQVIESGTRGVRALAFSGDGKLLATAASKAPVALWDVNLQPLKDAEPDS